MSDNSEADINVLATKLGGVLDDITKKAKEAAKQVDELVKQFVKLGDASSTVRPDNISGVAGAPTASFRNGGDPTIPQASSSGLPNGGGPIFSGTFHTQMSSGRPTGRQTWVAGSDGVVPPSGPRPPQFSSIGGGGSREIVKANILNPTDMSYGDGPPPPTFTSQDVGNIAKMAKGAGTAVFSLLPDAEEGIRRVSMAETISLATTGSTQSRFTRRTAVANILESQNAITGINSDMELQAVLASNNRGANIAEVGQVAQTAAWAQRYGYSNAEAAEMSMGVYSPSTSNALLNYTGIATMNADGSDKSMSQMVQQVYSQYIAGDKSFQGEKGAQNLERYLRDTGALESMFGESAPLAKQMIMEMRQAEDMGVAWSEDNNSEFAKAIGKDTTVLESQGERDSKENSRTEAGATDAAAGYKTTNEWLGRLSEGLEAAYKALGPFTAMLQRLNGGGVAINTSPVGQAGLNAMRGVGDIFGGAMGLAGSGLSTLLGARMIAGKGGLGGFGGMIRNFKPKMPGGGGGAAGASGFMGKASKGAKAAGGVLRKVPGVGKIIGVGLTALGVAGGAMAVSSMLRPEELQGVDLSTMSPEELEQYGLTPEDVETIQAEESGSQGAGGVVAGGVAAGGVGAGAYGVNKLRNRGPKTWTDSDGHTVVEGETAKPSPHKPPSGIAKKGLSKGLGAGAKTVGKSLLRKVPVIGWALSAGEVAYAAASEKGNAVDKAAAGADSLRDMFDPSAITRDVFGEDSTIHKIVSANPMTKMLDPAKKFQDMIRGKFGAKDKPLEAEEETSEPTEEPGKKPEEKAEGGTMGAFKDALSSATEALTAFTAAVSGAASKAGVGAAQSNRDQAEASRTGTGGPPPEGDPNRLQLMQKGEAGEGGIRLLNGKRPEGPVPSKDDANKIGIMTSGGASGGVLGKMFSGVLDKFKKITGMGGSSQSTSKSSSSPYTISMLQGAASPLGAAWDAVAATTRSVLSNPLAAVTGSAGGSSDSSSSSGGGTPYEPSAGVEQWRPVVERVVKDLGIDPKYVDGILGQIQQESSGNPNAVNDNDSNWQQGIASFGLLQTIASTFASYAPKGTDLTVTSKDVAGKPQEYIAAMTDPYANIYAGVNYAKTKYGMGRLDEWNSGIHNAYSQGATRIPRDQLAYLHTNEMVLPADVAESFRKVLAEQRSGYGNGTGTVNINVTLNNASESEARRLVDTVTDTIQDYYNVRTLTRS